MRPRPRRLYHRPPPSPSPSPSPSSSSSSSSPSTSDDEESLLDEDTAPELSIQEICEAVNSSHDVQFRDREGNVLDEEKLLLRGHGQITAIRHNFHAKMDAHVKSVQFFCAHCKERFFDKTKSEKFPEKCKDCVKSLKDHGTAKMTSDNDMDPYCGPDNLGYPFWLPELTNIEEMLIALVFVNMKAYQLINGQYGYRGQVLSMEQDISDIVGATTLPHRAEDLPCVIVRRVTESSPEGFMDFKVRRGHVYQWLYHLKQYNPYYKDVTLSMDNLNEYPVDGCVADRIRVVELADVPEEEADPGPAADPLNDNDSTVADAPATATATATANANANANAVVQHQDDDDDDDIDDSDEKEDEDDVGPENQQELGPNQGGASGAPEEENQVEETYMELPVGQTVAQLRQLEDLVHRNFGDDQPIPWPATGGNLSDYNTPGLFIMAYPTLFPYGVGDVT